MSVTVSNPVRRTRMIGGRRVPYDEITLTFTSADPTDFEGVTVSTSNFSAFCAESGINEGYLFGLRGVLTAGAASITPRIVDHTTGVTIAQCSTSTASSQDQAGHASSYTPLPFPLVAGQQLDVYLGPDVTGSGIVVFGIGPGV